MASFRTPSVPFLGDRLNPINALAFSFVLIFSVLFLPSFKQSLQLTFVAVLIILISFICEQFNLTKRPSDNINLKESKELETSQTIPVVESSISSKPITDISTETKDETSSQLNQAIVSEADVKEDIVLQPVLQPSTTIETEPPEPIESDSIETLPLIETQVNTPVPERRLRRSSSTCETAFKGLGGWSPSLYLARFNRFQMLELPSTRILPPNAREVSTFENDFFKGSILTMLKTDPPDEVYAEHLKTRLVEFQIQGCFKKKPKGILYMGVELPGAPLRLGLVMGATVKLCMKFASSRVSNLHWSLGSGSGENIEAPHMVMPIFRAMDLIVKTEEGQEPPKLGTELPESKHNASMRRSGQSPEAPFEVGPIYSFSFHNSFTNFPKWSIDGMPTGPINLRQVIGNSPIHMVVYDLEENARGKHTAMTKRYFLRVQMSYDLKFPLPQLDKEEEDMEIETHEEAKEIVVQNVTQVDVDSEDDELGEDPLNGLTPIEDSYGLLEDHTGASIDMGSPEDMMGPQLIVPEPVLEAILTPPEPLHPSAVTSPRTGDMDEEGSRLSALTRSTAFAFSPRDRSPSRSDSIELESTFPGAVSTESRPAWLQSGSVFALASNAQQSGYNLIDKHPRNNTRGILSFDEGKNAAVVRMKGAPTLVRLMRVASYHTISDPSSISPTRKRGSSGTSPAPCPPSSDLPEHCLHGGDVVVLMDAMTGKLLSVSPQETTTAGAVASGMTYGVARSALAVGGGVMSIGGRVAGAAWTVGGAIVGSGQGKANSGGGKGSNQGSQSNGRSGPSNQESSSPTPASTSSSGNRRWRETLVWTSVAVTNNTARVWTGKRAPQREFSIIGIPVGQPITFGDLFRLGGTGQWKSLVLRIDCLPTLKHGGHLLRLSGATRRGSREGALSNRVYQGALLDNLASVGVGTIRVDRCQNSPELSPLNTAMEAMPSVGSGSSLFDLDLWAINCSTQYRHLVSMPTLLPSTIKQMACDSYGMFHGGYFEVDIPGWIQCMDRSKRNVMSAFLVRVRWKDASFLKSDPSRTQEHKDEYQIRSFLSLRTGSEMSPVLQAFQRISGKASLSGLSLNSDEAPLKSLMEPDRNVRVLSRAMRKITLLNSGGVRLTNQQGPTSRENDDPVAENNIKSGVATVRALLHNILMVPSSLDSSFLRGGAADLGVDGNLISNSSLLPSTSASSVSSSKSKRHSSFSSNISGSSSCNGSSNRILWSAVTARCVWEAHWREEVAVFFSSHLAFYAPHSKKPSTMILSNDITKCRIFTHRTERNDDEDCPQECTVSEEDAKVASPLSGLPCLVIETVGRCHYLCFASFQLLQQAYEGINETILGDDTDSGESEEEDTDYIDQTIPKHEVLIDPRQSFILTAARWRGRSRLVLNARKFMFDFHQLDNTEVGGGQTCLDYTIAADLLKAALSLKPEPSPKMSKFLDMAASLRTLPRLPKLPNLSTSRSIKSRKLSQGDDEQITNLPSQSTFLSKSKSQTNESDAKNHDPFSIHMCFWVNLYHALLQHALLLLGAPRCQRDWISFHSSISYELFGNVFSLSDIEYCVLRGASLRSYPVSGCASKFSPKHPPSDDERRPYAVTPFDPRLNFVLHGGVINSVGSNINVLYPHTLHEVLNNCTTKALRNFVLVDVWNRSLILPHPFGAHPADFSSSIKPPDELIEEKSRVSAPNSRASNSGSNTNSSGGGGGGGSNMSQRIRTGDAIKFCLRHVGREQWKQLSVLLLDWDISKPPTVQYSPHVFESHDSLYLVDESGQDPSASFSSTGFETPKSSDDRDLFRRSASVDD
mmetsp:Transcript_12844/g.15345  ORF Transcript_12844/g.15345 Transcript_12844/m.15345 type:complete len:1797 (-) Transcript_12844:17-5407(-)